MRQVLVARPSSVVEAITNSSSEAFVVSDGRTLKEIRQLVHGIFETAWSDYLALKEQGTLGEYDYYQFSDVESPHGLYEVFKAEEELEWFGGRIIYRPGDIVVESSGDNSIPEELCDDIERLLGATRYHLG